jgi:hypothetical protein
MAGGAFVGTCLQIQDEHMANVPSGVYALLGATYTHACQNAQRANGSLDNGTVKHNEIN